MKVTQEKVSMHIHSMEVYVKVVRCWTLDEGRHSLGPRKDLSAMRFMSKVCHCCMRLISFGRKNLVWEAS